MITAPRVKRRPYRSPEGYTACRPDGWHWRVHKIGPARRAYPCGIGCPFYGRFVRAMSGANP